MINLLQGVSGRCLGEAAKGRGKRALQMRWVTTWPNDEDKRLTSTLELCMKAERPTLRGGKGRVDGPHGPAMCADWLTLIPMAWCPDCALFQAYPEILAVFRHSRVTLRYETVQDARSTGWHTPTAFWRPLRWVVV